MAIGSKIMHLRKKYNLTQEKLAEKVDVSRQTLSNWEGEVTTPDLIQATKLSKILHVSLDELVDNDVEIACKKNKESQILNPILDKTCYLMLDDDFFDMDINETIPIKVLSVSEDFMKIEYKKGNKRAIKLIDMDFIVAVKAVEGEWK